MSLGYLAALRMLWLNRAQPWFPLLLLGTALNGAAILANGGRMPVSRTALERIGGALVAAVDAGADPRHVLAGPGTPLGFLGDQVALGYPGAGLIVSPGDLLLACGIAGLVQWGMRQEDSIA